MTFLHPLLGWGFLSLPIILALYLLKRKYEIRVVPSTFLWKKTARELSADRPFQRLKKNILLPIQLLIAAALVLALMQPVLTGNVGGETLMIFDLSASMQASEAGVSRLDEAKAAAGGVIDGLGANDALTILAVGRDTRQLLSRSTDRDAARRALSRLSATNGDVDLSGALSLAEAMKKELGGLNIIVFSDDFVPQSGVAVHNAAHGAQNRAALSFYAEGQTGYARVANFGDDAEITLACYAEGELCDARTLSIPAGETAGATLHVPDCRWAYVEIQEADAIAADNRAYYVFGEDTQYTVAISEDAGVFLESAVNLREDIRLLRVSDEELSGIEADAYIYGTDALFFSLDARQTEITAAEEALEVASGEAIALSGADELTASLTLKDVAVRAYRPLTGGRSLMRIADYSVMAAGERTVALGFDIHDTNLPMKYDFPILVQNILNDLLPEGAENVGEGLCGEGISIRLRENGDSAQVVLPSGARVALDSSGNFTQTDEVGLYSVVENVDGAVETCYFALRMPSSQSDVRSVAPSVEADGSSANFESGRPLNRVLIACALVLLMLEWVVRRRVA